MGMKMNPLNFVRPFLMKMAGMDPAVYGSFPSAFAPGAGRATWSSWDFKKYALEAFMGNPFIYSAVTQRQTAMSRIRVYLQVTNAKGDDVDLRPDHPAWKLIRRPSVRFPSWSSWVKAMVGYKMIGGDAYALAIGPSPFGSPKPEPPVVLHPLGPAAMKTIGDKRLGYIKGFEYCDADQKKTNYLPDEVLWWSSWNPLTEWRGLSVITPGEKSVDMNNAAREYNKSLLDNGGFPGSILTTEDPTFKKTQADEVKASLREGYTGPDKAGKWLVLWGGLKPFQIGMSPVEMGFERLHQISAIEAALITNTPPELLGDASQKTFANYREAVLAFYTGTVIPENDDFLGNVSAFLQKRYDEPIVAKQDLDSIDALAALREEARKSVREDFMAGIIKRKEARDSGGWSLDPKDPTLDEYFSGQAPVLLKSDKKSWTAFLNGTRGDRTERKSKG